MNILKGKSQDEISKALESLDIKELLTLRYTTQYNIHICKQLHQLNLISLEELENSHKYYHQNLEFIKKQLLIKMRRFDFVIKTTITISKNDITG